MAKMANLCQKPGVAMEKCTGLPVGAGDHNVSFEETKV